MIRYIRYLDSDRTTVGQIPPPPPAAIQPCARAFNRLTGTKTALREDHTIFQKRAVFWKVLAIWDSEGLQR